LLLCLCLPDNNTPCPRCSLTHTLSKRRSRRIQGGATSTKGSPAIHRAPPQARQADARSIRGLTRPTVSGGAMAGAVRAAQDIWGGVAAADPSSRRAAGQRAPARRPPRGRGADHTSDARQSNGTRVPQSPLRRRRARGGVSACGARATTGSPSARVRGGRRWRWGLRPAPSCH